MSVDPAHYISSDTKRKRRYPNHGHSCVHISGIRSILVVGVKIDANVNHRRGGHQQGHSGPVRAMPDAARKYYDSIGLGSDYVRRFIR